jgi:very-short-patch-repair endonuclease
MAEAELWNYLKNSQLGGRKFRRQHSINRYVYDFYCPSEKLVVELDGETHNDAIGLRNDLRKEKQLATFGIKCLRFENRMIFDDITGVLALIKENFGLSRGISDQK